MLPLCCSAPPPWRTTLFDRDTYRKGSNPFDRYMYHLTTSHFDRETYIQNTNPFDRGTYRPPLD